MSGSTSISSGSLAVSMSVALPYTCLYNRWRCMPLLDTPQAHSYNENIKACMIRKDNVESSLVVHMHAHAKNQAGFYLIKTGSSLTPVKAYSALFVGT